MDFEREGLLDGLEGEDRAARVQLLNKLVADGVELGELKEAVAEDRLVLVSLERVLGGRYTAAEVAERADISVDGLLRVRRALGLPETGPEERAFSDDDVQAAAALTLMLSAGLPEEGVLEATRVLGEGMSRFAATVTALFTRAFLRPGDSELDLAERFEAMAVELAPRTTPLLTAVLNAHLRENSRRGMLGRAEREAGSTSMDTEIVVCFADLVGFTRLGGEVDAGELGELAGRLAELAAEVAKAPVRLVKTIGDAAMFVSPEAPPLVEAALALVRAGEQAELPALRCGIASGPALQRAGDWYGHAVNLASRVTGIARPGSVLATDEIRLASPEAFAWSFAGRHRLKGVPEPLALHRAREPVDSSDHEPGPRGHERDASRARRRRSS